MNTILRHFVIDLKFIFFLISYQNYVEHRNSFRTLAFYHACHKILNLLRLSIHYCNKFSVSTNVTPLIFLAVNILILSKIVIRVQLQI